jgi:hypothetical protein
MITLSSVRMLEMMLRMHQALMNSKTSSRMLKRALNSLTEQSHLVQLNMHKHRLYLTLMQIGR